MIAETKKADMPARPRAQTDGNTVNTQDAFPRTPKLSKSTDHRRWRMKDDDARQTWHYLEDDASLEQWPQSYADKWSLGLPTGLPSLPRAETALDATKNGLTFIEKIQLPSGHWAGECSGPMLFNAGFIIAWYVTKTPIPDAVATEIKNYLLSRTNTEDGGWGIHSTGSSMVFTTALNYTTLRLLGVEADEPRMTKARRFIHAHGGALNASLWTKFWLSVLGVMEWDVVNPLLPELWLLPEWLPFHPSRFYCEIRAVLLAVGYLYSRRWSCEETKLTRELKKELFVQPHSQIKWSMHRNSIAAIDNLHPRSWIFNIITWLLINVYMRFFRTDAMKAKAEARVSEIISMDDNNTDYSGIAATNAPMNTVVCLARDGPNSYTVKRHLERLQQFMWMTKDGMNLNSTNGGQTWDTNFMMLGVIESGLHTDERWKPMMNRALGFLDRHQIREDCEYSDRCYRQRRKGGWTFSNKDQGYAVSDCTAEALKAVIMLQKSGHYPQALDDQRIFDAVDTILPYQNSTGGVSAFEARRGGEYLEMLNASEVLGRFVVEYDYPECTTSCVTALSLFQKYWPEYRTKDIQTFIDRAVKWIKNDQREDGSWYGSWGICFTYATMFALESMAGIGETYANSQTARKGCDFLISKQRGTACETREYHEDPLGSLVVQTAWALIALMEAGYPNAEHLKKGIQLMISRQQNNGEWLHEAIEGNIIELMLLTSRPTSSADAELTVPIFSGLEEATIQSRWTKKTKRQKLQILLSVWPDMTDIHRPDFRAFRSIIEKNKGFFGYRDSWMWPYFNQDDLTNNNKALVLMLNSRGRHPDCEAMHLGMLAGSLSIVLLPEYTMVLNGVDNSKDYGKLLYWKDHPYAKN
ncbi:Terpene cyclase/mutase atnI [Cladobotryum mycophilum]|uniref:Terpene cyclase/mutase family member n=1 Tax=Cladobotryum mycophilum TaxID=491253 RepID=A0ABR0SDR3_9HYPO